MLETLGSHRGGVSKKRGVGLASTFQALDQQPVFVLQHALQTGETDVAATGRAAVDGVREGHVVGRHGLGHGAGGATGAKEITRRFLPGADLDDAAVLRRVQIDGQRLLQGARRVHR